MLFLKIAFRNVFRSKRRTFITFSAISLGLALLIIAISLINGTEIQAITNLVNSETSHLKILKKGYVEKQDELPLNIRIKEPGPVQSLLKKIPGVKECDRRILFALGLIKGMDELPCQGVGIDTETDPRVFNIKESLREGSWLEPSEAKILVGTDLARDVGLAVGDTVTLRMITSSKGEELSWNALDVEIKGIYAAGNPAADSRFVILPLELAQEGLGLGSDVTEIAVRLDLDPRDDKRLGKIQRQIKALLKSQAGDLEVFSWKELSGTFLAINESKKERQSMIIMLMLLVASLGIINTLMMAVFERTGEIGMLSAMGMKPWEIKKLFIFEGGIIGLFGSALGCILGGLVGWYLEVKGWSFASWGNTGQKFLSSIYPVKDVYYGDLTFDLLIFAFILGTAISVLASLYPASRAAKLDPIKALRET